jgi:hypothetical protein
MHQALALRVGIILACVEEKSNTEVSAEVRLRKQTVSLPPSRSVSSGRTGV